MNIEPGTPTTHGRAESAQTLKRNPKQKIQFEAKAQNTRRCMLYLLAGPMMFCGLGRHLAVIIMRPASISRICLRMYWLDVLFVFPALSRHSICFSGTRCHRRRSSSRARRPLMVARSLRSPPERNPKQKIQFEAKAQNTRWCMLFLLAGPMMFCGLWPPPCGDHHAARQCFRICPHMYWLDVLFVFPALSRHSICFSGTVFIRYPVPQMLTTRGLVPAAIKR